MTRAGVPFEGILFTVFQSIFQVFLLCLSGFILSFKGIVDKPTSKVLNYINTVLFTPALLFSKVAYFLTPAKLRQLWVIPVFFAVVTGLSAVIAYWLARACRLKQSQVNFATAASMFMNSNSLPVALMQSLVATIPILKWGPDDTVDAMFGRSLTYLVVFSTLGMILRWSYGIRLISSINEADSPVPTPTPYRDNDGANECPKRTCAGDDAPVTPQLIDYETEADTKQRARMSWHTRPLRSRLHPRFTPLPWRQAHARMHRHSHLPVVPTSLGDQSDSDDSDEIETTEGDSEETIVLRPDIIETEFSTDPQDASSAPAPFASTSEPDAHSVPRWNRSSPPLPNRILTFLTSLSPPLVASLLALACVLIPPVQRLLLSEGMSPFKGALDNAGACSVPLTMIILGGWFWDGNTKPKDDAKCPEQDSDSQGNAKNKGKGTEPHYHHSLGNDNGIAPTLYQRRDVDAPTTAYMRLHLGGRIDPQSRDSSAGSLSSMFGVLGDAVMSGVHPLSRSLRTKRHLRKASERDVEPGLLGTPAETENASAENTLGTSSQSRSRSDSANGHPRLSHLSSSSSTSSQPLPDSSHTQSTDPPGETLTIFITLLARMCIVPLVFTPLMALISRLGWGGEVFEDPVFIVSSMLLIASPPALTLAQISQRTKTTMNPDTSSSFERLLSRTVFWSYCILTPPLTIVSIMVGLLLI